MAIVVYKGARVDLLAGNVTRAECDGSGYSRIALASVAVATDDVNDRHEVTAAAGSFGADVAAGRDPGLRLLSHPRAGRPGGHDPSRRGLPPDRLTWPSRSSRRSRRRSRDRPPPTTPWSCPRPSRDGCCSP